MACVNSLATVPRSRRLSTTAFRLLDQRWRLARGLPMNPTARGALTDGADYSYLDGRLTPAGVGQRERLVEQRSAVEKIVALSEEMDFAVRRHATRLEAEEERKRATLRAKLKGRTEKV